MDKVEIILRSRVDGSKVTVETRSVGAVYKTYYRIDGIVVEALEEHSSFDVAKGAHHKWVSMGADFWNCIARSPYFGVGC